MLLGATVDCLQERSTGFLVRGQLRQHPAVVMPLEKTRANDTELNTPANDDVNLQRENVNH
jgi:hypothetical protein